MPTFTAIMVTWPWTNYIAFCLRQKLYHAITSKERQSVSLCSESRRRVLNLPGCPTISANVACSITSREWQAREHTGARPSICCIVKLPTSLIPGYLTTARTWTPLISRFEESYSTRRGLTVSTNSTSDWLKSGLPQSFVNTAVNKWNKRYRLDGAETICLMSMGISVISAN